MRLIPAFLIASSFCCAQSADVAKYSNKFAEVLRDGLVVGYCSGTSFAGVDLDSRWVGVSLEFKDFDAPKMHDTYHCPTQPVQKGEILTVDKVRVIKHGALALALSTVPHAINRGSGPYEHQSVEIGHVGVYFSSKLDLDALVSQWFKFSDTVQRDQLANTASMVAVKEVKLGMSFAEVEQALGLPITRVDLDSKVLYKYKDMTVEFHDGKVTDVR